MTITLKDINNKRELIFIEDEKNLKQEEKSLLDSDGKDFDEIKEELYSEKNRIIFEKWLRDKSGEIFVMVNEGISYSSLIGAKIYAIVKNLDKKGFKVSISLLPLEIKEILELSFKKTGNEAPQTKKNNLSLLEAIGEFSYRAYKKITKCMDFTFEAFKAVLDFLGGTAVYRKKDFAFILEDCSYKAVGIISLVSFLVGLIIAFVGAIQLKSFGAGIYVASMVSIGMTRIMGAIMVGIVMAGRTGSSFAATLGTMVVNEEVDALKTLGIKISQYLVAPRIIAIVMTIPSLTLLADFLGILGGSIVGVVFLGISSSNYFIYASNVLSLNNILIGLFHSIVYGMIIGISGCYAGLEVKRDADSVGKATTSAVVYALVWMIVATGIITVILEVMDL
ncbi:MAG: ABC transporter permease [Alphaproteobacteria bacterium]|nr:ABC transporter permease [Alphaproteobacteria bacterium]